MNATKGKLYLIPTPLEPSALDTMPEAVKTLTLSLKFFVVESEKAARRFLITLHRSLPQYPWNMDEICLARPSWEAASLSLADIERFLEPALKGYSMGLLSDCGAPAIADPGAILVYAAHRVGITVAPLPGPSSLFLALMASGLNAQNFHFHGYLPPKAEERKKKILLLERQSHQTGQTQLFIETPYRNQTLFNDLIRYCLPQTLLCLAFNLSGTKESVLTMPIEQWKTQKRELPKEPAIFLIGAPPFKLSRRRKTFLGGPT